MRPGLLLFLLLLAGFACRKEIISDNSDKNFPLTLRVTTSGENTFFNWDEANVAHFEKFVLVRSAEPIPIGSTNPFNSANFIVFETKDFKITSTTESDIFFDSVGYYKLYLQIGERWLESNQVAVNNQSIVVEGNYFASYFLPDSNWVVLLFTEQATGLGKIMLVDYINNKKAKSVAGFSLLSPEQLGVDINYTNGKPELWLWSSDGYLVVALPDLTTIRSASLTSNQQFSIAGGGSGIIMATQNATSSSFNVRKKSNLSILKSYSRQNYYEHRSLLVLDTATNLMVEISPFKIDLFSIHAPTGTLNTGGMLTQNTNGFSPYSINIPVSHDRQFFCPYLDGIVYDRNLDVVFTPSLSNEIFIDMCFSQDGQFMYVLTNNFTSTAVARIRKISFPGGEVVKTLNLSNTPSRISSTPDGLVTILSKNNFPDLNIFVKKIVF